jgi:hypothetical protein
MFVVDVDVEEKGVVEKVLAGLYDGKRESFVITRKASVRM